MLAYNVGEILRAASTLRQLEYIILGLQENNQIDKNAQLSSGDCKIIYKHLQEMGSALSGLQLKMTMLAVDEFKPRLRSGKNRATYSLTADLMRDIAITLRRELNLVKTFCIEPKHDAYFQFDFDSVGAGFEAAFPTVIYELDEAGKCHALGRSTACVFHLMRAMEVGIKATARSLGIPDPIKGADRNWGKILEKIKLETDVRNKAGNWKGGDKEFFQSTYASLDSVRVAWRNTTMHVENKYTDDEAEHIFVAVRGFMKKLASRCDEQGQPQA